MTQKEMCAVCMEMITNPICTNCYLKQINSWLKSMNIKSLPRSIIINKIRERSANENLSEENCILCGASEINLCAYCFFSVSARVLREFNFPENIVQVFDAQFSYKEA